jgi:hypothetical protein
MVNKKDIAMKNWFRTDCKDGENISVKQAYELGFNRAYGLMQSVLNKFKNTPVDKDIEKIYYVKKETVREFLERIKHTDQAVLEKIRVRISDIDGYEHMDFRLYYYTDLDSFNNVFDQQMLDSYVDDSYIDRVNDDDDFDWEVTIIAGIEL